MSEQTMIAVTGASGLLGRPLLQLLSKASGYLVRGAALRRTGGIVDRVDITSRTAIEAWLERIHPSILIHLAAERRPDVYASNPEAADRLNISATEDLASICRDRGVPLLFLSTNYVFDGTSAPYSPDDEPNPLNSHGRSKREGEKAVVAASDTNRALRVPMLYGPSASLEESSATQIAATLRKYRDSSKPVPFDVRQRRYPAFTPDVAAAIVGLLPELQRGSLPGPYLHFCPGPDEGLTKRDMAEIIAPYVGVPSDLAVADTKPPTGAPRPENVRMLCPVMENLGLMKTTPFHEAIDQTMESIRSAGGLD